MTSGNWTSKLKRSRAPNAAGASPSKGKNQRSSHEGQRSSLQGQRSSRNVQSKIRVISSRLCLWNTNVERLTPSARITTRSLGRRAGFEAHNR